MPLPPTVHFFVPGLVASSSNALGLPRRRRHHRYYSDNNNRYIENSLDLQLVYFNNNELWHLYDQVIKDDDGKPATLK